MTPDRGALHLPSSVLHPRPILLAGPTAVGKSAVAVLLAEGLGGEIISVDSMQVYRGLDIGTAKPTAAERQRVPHHLVDLANLTEAFDAAQFVALAQRAKQEIQLRGRTPILCGGTGLYFKAFLEGLGEAPATDPKLRAELETTPLPDLLRELAERDPEAWGKIDHKNPRRVIRAVEMIRLTGKPCSAQRAPWARERAAGISPAEPRVAVSTTPSLMFFGLSRVTDDLRARIDTRVDAMFRNGLVEETQALLRHGLAENRTAMQAIGYRQVVEHLRGERSLADTIALVKQRTRQFARRQMTWFRRQANLQWVKLQPEDRAEDIAARLVREAVG